MKTSKEVLSRGFTLVELLIVVAIIGILLLRVPARAGSRLGCPHAPATDTSLLSARSAALVLVHRPAVDSPLTCNLSSSRDFHEP